MQAKLRLIFAPPDGSSGTESGVKNRRIHPVIPAVTKGFVPLLRLINRIRLPIILSALFCAGFLCEPGVLV